MNAASGVKILEATAEGSTHTVEAADTKWKQVEESKTKVKTTKADQ